MNRNKKMEHQLERRSREKREIRAREERDKG